MHDPLGASSDKVVILDRDGTIVVDRGYLADPNGLEFIPGASEALRWLFECGYRLVVITNQSGVGRGLFSIEAVETMNARLYAMVEAIGAKLAKIYFCPHAPEANCACRKPNLALMDQAANELRFDPRASVVVGDKESDVEIWTSGGGHTNPNLFQDIDLSARKSGQLNSADFAGRGFIYNRWPSNLRFQSLRSACLSAKKAITLGLRTLIAPTNLQSASQRRATAASPSTSVVPDVGHGIKRASQSELAAQKRLHDTRPTRAGFAAAGVQSACERNSWESFQKSLGEIVARALSGLDPRVENQLASQHVTWPMDYYKDMDVVSSTSEFDFALPRELPSLDALCSTDAAASTVVKPACAHRRSQLYYRTAGSGAPSFNGGTNSMTTVSSGQTQYVSSDQTASGTIVLSGVPNIYLLRCSATRAVSVLTRTTALPKAACRDPLGFATAQ